MKSTFDNSDRDIVRPTFRGGVIHLTFCVDKQLYLYTYIRKNACSAFKNFIARTSDNFNLAPKFSDQLNFLTAHHRVNSAEEIDIHSATNLFVYRDPAQRVVSCFVNKFITRSGYADIFNSYKVLTGADPSKASFSDFVSTYLLNSDGHIDPHLWSMKYHLLPAKYRVINMGNLYEEIIEFVGDENAKAFFKNPRNASNYTGLGEYVGYQSSEQLHKIYMDTEKIPSFNELVSPDLLNIVRARYHSDYELAF